MKERNYKGIQYEKIRVHLDSEFNKLHDELTECYYKFWKHGKSKPFQNHDVQETPEKSKELFDKLHGLIFLHYEIAFDDFNNELPENERIDKSEYDENKIVDKIEQVVNEDGSIKDVISYTGKIKSSVKSAKDNIKASKIKLDIDVKAIKDKALNGYNIHK